MTDTMWWIVGAIVIAAALIWWISSSRTPAAPPPLEKTAETKPEVDTAPVVAGPAATPMDVPPPVPEAAPVAPAAAGPADDLTVMKGVGPKVTATLASLGVTRFDQIAAWSEADAARIDGQLGAFKGRVARDQWIEQARLLAAGDKAGYEAKFGKLG